MSFEASDVCGATTGAIAPKIECWIFRKINLSPELNGGISARLNPFWSHPSLGRRPKSVSSRGPVSPPAE